MALMAVAALASPSEDESAATLDPDEQAIKDGNVALCNDGNYSDNTDFSATCSGGDGIDKWLAPFGECEDGTVIKMSDSATCGDNGGFKGLLPADFEPTPRESDVALCKDGTYADNTDFSATCSSRGGVDGWLAPYGECKDGTVIVMSKEASCAGNSGFKGLLPEDYEPPTTTTTAPPATTAPPTTTTTIAAAYAGPAYEVVAVVERAGMGELDQYWVYTAPLDYSTDAYKAQIKQLITEVARSAGTDKLLIDVVTDKEIAEANADPAKFEAERGTDYWLNVIPEKERTGWIASYAGGIDYDAGTLSDSDTAFGIDWFLASDNPTSERWRP